MQFILLRPSRRTARRAAVAASVGFAGIVIFQSALRAGRRLDELAAAAQAAGRSCA